MRFKWLLDLSNQGVDSSLDDDVSRRIIFSNIVFISLPVVYMIFMVIDYKVYLQPFHSLRFDQFIVPIVIGVCIFCLWLNKLNQTTFSRILFIILWPILLHLIPIKILQTPIDYYIAFPMGIVFHAMLIQLMLSHRAEPIFFWPCIILNGLSIYFASDILLSFDLDRDFPAELVNYEYYRLDGILYWLLFNLVTFYMIWTIEKYILKIRNSRMLIENQKEELNVLNKNLGNIVAQRTQKLEEQNKKLRDHAFYNAHLLRGPFCRIQGLIQLQELIKDDDEKNEIMSKLKISVEELENRIKEIQEIVDADSKAIH